MTDSPAEGRSTLLVMDVQCGIVERFGGALTLLDRLAVAIAAAPATTLPVIYVFYHGRIARIVRHPDLARGEREREPATRLDHARNLGDGPLRVRPEVEGVDAQDRIEGVVRRDGVAGVNGGRRGIGGCCPEGHGGWGMC
jgi:hypothetical protein